MQVDGVLKELDENIVVQRLSSLDLQRGCRVLYLIFFLKIPEVVRHP